MSHELEIQYYATDGQGDWIYNLLEGKYQIPPAAEVDTGLSVDLNSIVLNPLDNGNYEITYRIFGKNINPQLTRQAIQYLDSIVYTVNKYTDNPSSTTGLCIYEKSEPETTGRRAILTNASFQPLWESSVGPLMIRDGWVGLLRFERGEWEDPTVETSTNHTLTISQESTFAVSDVLSHYPITFGGTLNSRVRSVDLSVTYTKIGVTVIGVRGDNVDVTSYQPIGNMGAGLTYIDGDGPIDPGGPTQAYEMIPYSPTGTSTYPTEQATPTYTGYYHNVFYANSYTHYLRLYEISTSQLDSINDDYIGDYEVFIRTSHGFIDAGAFVKYTLGTNSYGEKFAENDPIYVETTDDNYKLNVFSLGRVSIPTTAFAAGLGGSFLANFAFSLTTEIITGDVVLSASDKVYVDSIFLMPINSVSITNRSDFNWTDVIDMDITYAENPIGNTGFILSSGTFNTFEMAGRMSIPPGDGRLVVLKQWEGSAAGTPAGSIQVKTFPKYNTIK